MNETCPKCGALIRHHLVIESEEYSVALPHICPEQVT